MSQDQRSFSYDIELRVPQGMPLPVDPELAEFVARRAGEMRMQCALPDGAAEAADPKARLIFVLGLLRQAVFAHTQHTIAEFAGAQSKVECRAGCTFCCYQNVDVTIPEAILVALQLADPADPRRRRVLETADKLSGLDDTARIATAVPCPLLAAGRCSVYADRPLACRSLLSPDQARCEAALTQLQAGEGVGQIEAYVVLQFVCSGDQAALRGICKDLGLQHDVVELSQAVAAILREPSLVDRWAAGERVFAPR